MSQRFSFSRKSKRLAAVIAGLLVLSVVGVALAAHVTLDTFDSTDNGLLNNPFYIEVRSSPVGSRTASIQDVDTTAIGGGREGVMNWVSGTGRGTFSVDDLGNTRLAFSTVDGVSANATIRWDGTAGTATANDCGLNNVDLIDASPVNDGFHMEVINDDLPTAITFRIYSGATCANMSTHTVNLPGGIISPAHVDFFVPFADFSGTADFTAVRAIEVYIDGTVTPGTDVSIDFLDADNFREYGDLPRGGYSNAIVDAYQIPQGLRLGRNVDIEVASQPDVNAGTTTSGDDSAVLPSVDDEDGVERPDITKWTPGGTAALTVTVNGCTGTCYLNGWIDFQDNLNFADTGEQVYNDVPVIDGTVSRSFSVPASVAGFPGTLYSRFRICDTAGTCNAPDSTNVNDGEIEDYVWNFGPLAVTLNNLEAKADAQNNTAALVLAATVVAALGLAGVVISRRRTA